MGFKLVFLWTDIALYVLALALAGYVWHVRRQPTLQANWKKVMHDPAALSAGVVLLLFAGVAALDSVHFRRALAPAAPGGQVYYDTRTISLLDLALARQVEMREPTYSAPLATHGFSKESVNVGGQTVREFPRLAFGGAHLRDPQREWAGDVARRAALGALGGAAVFALVLLVTAMVLRRSHGSTRQALRDIAADRTTYPLRAMAATLGVVCLLGGAVVSLMGHYHVFGTDRTGNDVLLLALKSVRTAFVIGGLSTLATLPLAVVLGILAGYFKGWVDEVIQYFYTLLSSVPNVLLIAACVLMVQVFLDKNPEMFETGAERSDLKILLLCIVLGVTGWATLCRLVRGETLKLRELEYVQAATAFGVGHARIMARHILPNVMHLVLITTVLSFSELILYEAVLTYVGVGVDPGTSSFGSMINLARSEMSREPAVWWQFAAAFVFMVALVLSANLFADGVRDAFDPRSRSFRPRLGRGRPHAAG
ncbi:ABC transporter permease [Piscinibacter sp. HJYY11]|uniref:ABC transporter permease n=1 Tax=Piscinibacter sp. HJYY11 TaxID=2801333 RepID=UPI00191D6438|nr:ABC transporter permease [Piscinibacter sp. HJYY11]MBL0726295.1 ABC transporter permease [Piscinibacter sp. HJYY11]